MKSKFGIAIASLLLIADAGSASAADMAVKARPMAAPVPVWNWTGFYIGGSVGGIWNDTRDTISPTGCFINPAILCSGPLTNNPLRTDVFNMRGVGFIGGGQAGFNWQSGAFVGGIEGDISWTGINDSIFVNRPLAAPLVGNIVHSETDKNDWLATLRGRAGVTVTPSFLIYATGGLAVGRIRSATTVSFTAAGDTYVGTNSDTRAGWTVGAGGEWMLAPNWSIKVEYLYVDLGTSSYTNVCTTPAICVTPFAQPASYRTDLRVHEDIARVGLNYHFGGPVVAKY